MQNISRTMNARFVPDGTNPGSSVFSQDTSSSREFTLNSLPNEIIRSIFSFVGVRYTAILPLVCKRWKNLLNEDLTWALILSSSTKVDQATLQLSIKKHKSISQQLWFLRHQIMQPHLRLKEISPYVKCDVFVENGLLILQPKNIYNAIEVYDLHKVELKFFIPFSQGSFCVSRGAIYLLNYGENTLSAYDVHNGKILWSEDFPQSVPMDLFINRKRNHLYTFARYPPQIGSDIVIFDAFNGSCISHITLDMTSLRLLSVSGEYIYFIKKSMQSTTETVCVVNLDESDLREVILFEQETSQDKLQVIGAIHNNVHIVCSKHTLVVSRLLHNTCERVFTYTLPLHMEYVFRTPDKPVYALFEDLLCMHFYDSSQNKYFLQFWDMSQYKVVKEQEIAFKIDHIFYSGKKLIVLSNDSKILSVEFSASVDHITEKMRMCSII